MKYLSFCLVSVVAFVLSSGSVKTELPSTGYHPGEMIPDIVLTDSEGNYRNLHDYKGKKVVVNFWATYHAQSRANNVQLYNYLQNSNSDVEFVSVAFDENRNVVERTLIVDRLESISQFYEISGTGSETYKDFKLNGEFRNYLIDENGVIIAMNVTPEDLKTIL
ncbi:TlpA family protein disulfide reductase [Proteiniphilum acetatigenes]|uniref:TlpA family protein disulfide reductase n=1 Tax=Proteiniphilum acetatigenes TaxID=294710 RepID=UPI000380B7D4|nr:TlpA disulfide reductase family protein [Proteiniphilum acetatigenes]SFK54098.1 Peroxiredoxin [Porphyromonadaceae bacterium KH3CP3RA]